MKQPEHLTPETKTRRELRRICKSYPDGLYFFAKAICGFDRLRPHLHRSFANFIQLHPWNGGPQRSNRKMAWMPREHFKSTICSVAFPLWLLSCVDRNYTIALISANHSNSKQWLTQIKEIITYNPIFRWAFPEIRAGDKWDEERATITRDRTLTSNAQSSLTAYSINSGLASQHHRYIILDDPVNEQVAESDVMMEDAVRLYLHLEEILRGWTESGFLLVDTPWGREDPHHEALREVERGYRLKWGIGVLGEHEISQSLAERPELRPDVTLGSPILPSECDEDKLEHIKQQSIEKYYFQYLCKPYDVGRNGFDLDLFRDFAHLPDGRLLCQCHPNHYHHLSTGSTVAVSDPAYTQDKKNCESAILIGNKQPCECRFLLNEWGGHLIPPDYLKEAARQAAEWQTWMKGFGIESEALQVTLSLWLVEMQSKGEFPLGVEILELKPKKRHKDGRIASQTTPMNNGLWHKRPTMRLIEGKNNTAHQLFQWPYSRKRDRADAFGYFDDAWALKPGRGKKQPENPTAGVNARREEADLELFEQEEIGG